MPELSFIDRLNSWMLLTATVAIVLASLEAGYRLGVFRHRRSDSEKETPVGEVVAATLGLLAFLLAFTFGFAASRFESRKELVIQEANAVGTAWLRAGLLPAPESAESRNLYRDYVAARLEGVQTGDLASVIRQSEELHLRLWKHAENAAGKQDSMVRTGLYIQALNEVIDLHTERIAMGTQNRIPAVIWIALFAETVLAMGAMGYHAGLTGTSRSLVAFSIALAFSGVIVLIADLDNPAMGMIRTGQQALVDVQKMMEPR